MRVPTCCARRARRAGCRRRPAHAPSCRRTNPCHLLASRARPTAQSHAAHSEQSTPPSLARCVLRVRLVRAQSVPAHRESALPEAPHVCAPRQLRAGSGPRAARGSGAPQREARCAHGVVPCRSGPCTGPCRRGRAVSRWAHASTLAMADGEKGCGGGSEGLGGKLKELYEDEKRRINEKGITGAIAEHKT